MSLGTVYLKARDNRYYENPCSRGVTEKGNRWFVCYDEDDPPELVVEVTHGPESGTAILKAAGFTVNRLTSAGVSGRCFSKNICDPFIRAASYFFTPLTPAPIPNEHTGVFNSFREFPSFNATTLDYGRRPHSRYRARG